MKQLVDKLQQNQILSIAEFVRLIDGRNDELDQYLFEKARQVKQQHYGNSIYIRGLIETSNFCKNDCLYCGIRRSNKLAERYRLTKEQIYECCQLGYELGFRTFVLQGGEDAYFSDSLLVEIISTIKHNHPDCAITLSLGEKPLESYQQYYNAGADRYLLRHETADAKHYAQLHPEQMSSENRKQCLFNLKKIGFQTGSGFMVGSPFQTSQNLADDLLFIAQLQPQMVGIGPFLSHHQTPFADKKNGSFELTLFLLGLLRLMLPKVLLPATTALATISPDGRTRGILAGANIIMPNLSPLDVRKKYMIYDNKVATGLESSEYLAQLRLEVAKIGCQIEISRGDYCSE